MTIFNEKENLIKNSAESVAIQSQVTNRVRSDTINGENSVKNTGNTKE